MNSANRGLSSERPDLASALAAWRRIVGAQFISADRGVAAAAERATYPTIEGILAILRPADRQEVQACVGVADAFGIPLYTISTGKNWGFGSRVPTFDESVLLDLSRLNRIVEFNEELAYVVVEPGVTQRMLDVYLRTNSDGRLWLDATSSSPDCSVIGNLLERGHGVTTYCDHVAHAVNYEVVLPSGHCINTGYGAFENATVRDLDAWGLGPSLIGLFSQSNLGVVTRATIWLMRAPEQSAVAFFALDNDSALSDLLDELRPLRAANILKSGPFLGNVYQALPKIMSYPWTLTDDAVPLRLAAALELAMPHRYNLWNGSIGLYGAAEEVSLQRDRLSRALDGKAVWSAFISEDGDIGQTFPSSRHSEVRNVIAGYTGRIGGTGLRAPYWRMKQPHGDGHEVDLDRDGCGFRFWTAVSPFRGQDALLVSSIATDILLASGFEPSIGIFPVRERSLQFHISCAYDRGVAEHDAAVMTCHEKLSTALMDRGYYPARLGIGSMGALDRRDSAYTQLLRTLKDAIDPKGIFAPLRY